MLEIELLGTEIDYQQAWDYQKRVHAEVVSGSREDTILLLEHSSVYTAGKRTEIHERPTSNVPVIDVDRGGKITWHGPGQIVGYPILRLGDPMDVVDGRSGVWVTHPLPARKIAAIGIRVSQGVTLHGFALNCNNSLDPYHSIVPCGITDATVTTLSQESSRELTPSTVLPILQTHLRELTPIGGNAP